MIGAVIIVPIIAAQNAATAARLAAGPHHLDGVPVDVVVWLIAAQLLAILIGLCVLGCVLFDMWKGRDK